MSQVRLKDVAARAGVSVATVSRVLHGHPYVSANARERVERELAESGYRMNVVARELRRRRTITLGLIQHGALSTPFVAQVAVGAQQAAIRQGFNMLFFNSRGDPTHERESVEALLNRRVDGILFTTAVGRSNVELALDAGVPAVEITRRLSDRAASVVVDNYEGALQAMRHLFELGHREIGYIGEPFAVRRPADSLNASESRYAGYHDALRAEGIAFDSMLEVSGPYPREEGGWGGMETGARYMATLLRQAPRLTAVFAASDLLAAGALQTLYKRGCRVPDDLSLVGFDDTFAKHLSPPVTTVQQPMYEMGAKAAELAIRLVSSNGGPPPVERCDMTLIVRESTAPATAPTRSS